MPAPRVAPYVWVTWIARLLAGDAHCAWAAWFRAHHTYDRLPSDFDAAKWASEHTAMVREQVEALQQASYAVSVEDQNAFRLQGQLGVTLGGKPDIVAWRDGEVRVVECKTGQPRHTDTLQVMIYMLVLPHAQPVWRGRTLSGRVHYQTGPVDVPPEALDGDFRTRFREIMAQVGGDTALGRVPSFNECRFCDIGPLDCPDRIDTRPDAGADGGHDLF